MTKSADVRSEQYSDFFFLPVRRMINSISSVLIITLLQTGSKIYSRCDFQKRIIFKDWKQTLEILE